jgi:hypothetical protein
MFTTGNFSWDNSAKKNVEHFTLKNCKIIPTQYINSGMLLRD